MFPPMSGMQAFMRAANLGAPPVDTSPLPMIQTPQESTQNMPTRLPYDENINVPTEDPEIDMLQKFKESVLNPPQRTHMTYPKSTLNGLTEALKVAATPTDYEKNRVYIGDTTYQKAKIYTDPATGEKKYIQPYKQPGFMEQVMKAMPASVSATTDILNQPYQDELADYEMRNKGLSQAIGAEGQMALARQRNAAAAATGTKLDQGQQKIDISRMTAEERVRASQLNTMTDKEKLEALQQGKVTIADMNNAAALAKTQMQQSGANKRTEMQQTGANARTAAQQAGATQRTQMQQTGANQRNEANITSRLKLKQTPSAGANATSQLPTQQIKAAQLQASKAVQDHPEWEDYLSIDQNGMVHIDPPSQHWYDPGPDKDTYNEIKNYLRQGMPAQTTNSGTPAPITTDTTKPTPNTNTTPPIKAPGSSQMPPPKFKAAPNSPTLIPMTTPDGKGVRMVPQDQVQTATAQGYKPQQAKK